MITLIIIQVDHWLTFASGQLSCATEVNAALSYLDEVLGPVTYLVGSSLTLADFAVWDALLGKSLLIVCL